MPHVRCVMLVTIDAPPATALDAVATEAGLTLRDDGIVEGPFPVVPFEGSTLAASAEPTSADGRTQLRLEARTDTVVPFFGAFVNLQARVAARTGMKHLVDKAEAAITGAEAPPPPRRWPIVPPVPVTNAQAGRIAALAAVAMIVNFCGALLTQNGDAVTKTFDRSDEALGAALAIARAGVLVSLVVIALADRMGRRRLMLVALVGACAANAIAGLRAELRDLHGRAAVRRGHS